MRLALFSPLPPLRTGIAAYTAELVPLLAAAARIRAVDVYVDVGHPWRPGVTAARRATLERQLAWAPGGPASPPVRVMPVHAFQPAHLREPYDVLVYQLGNAEWHDYMWAYLVRYPGLVVLHDGQLHLARARFLLAQGRREDYRREFAFSHPDTPPAAAEFAVAGLRGSPYYLWPMLGAVMSAARGVAVHEAWLARDLAARFPSTPVQRVRMGVRQNPGTRTHASDAPPGGGGAERLRFAAFGLLTPEKRLPETLRAFRQVARQVPGAELILVGAAAPHYDVEGDIRGLGLEGRVTVTGYVADADLDGWIASADVCLCLRWPTTRETSASWLRCLAAGKPTVVTDLVHTADVPALDPRDWQVHCADRSARATLTPPTPRSAVAVAIDILDEAHSLELAMTRLATDAALRATLGANAAARWARDHTLDAMRDDYVAALAATAAAPRVPGGMGALPAHLGADGTALTRFLLDDLGLNKDPFAVT